MPDLAALQQTLGVAFKNIPRLEQALVHSSYINENPTLALTSNERLEFLGDAVLGLIIAEKLYQDFPHFNEGKLTKLRAALVRRDTLARMASAIHLGDYLYLGKGEEAKNGRHKPANLAAALEAVIAAIFLDRGSLAVRDFILKLLATELENAVSRDTDVDYKSALQELIQSRKQQTPGYYVIATTGPEHDRTFTVEVRLGQTVLGTGSGKSKKTAETEAARSALAKTSFTG
ncbi:MAG: ribonuclease III [Chloroflexi bacterium]|nr:ribonuclease III [Chloroflexota bacterium]